MHSSCRSREREHWDALISHQAAEPKRLWAILNSLHGRGRGWLEDERGRHGTDEEVQRLRIYQSSPRRYFWSALQTRYRLSYGSSSTIGALQQISSSELRRFILSSPSFLLSLPTRCAMYYIGYISLSGLNIVSRCVFRCDPACLCDLCCPVSV